jgi:cytochrome c5
MSKLGLLSICAFSLTAAMAADPVSGEAVYQRRCSGCHEQISPRIPNIATLKQMPATRILRTLDFGAMSAS